MLEQVVTGKTSKAIAIPLLADALAEGSESLARQVSNVSGASPARGAATVTILDATPPPQVSVADASLAEPASGSANANFVVSLSRAAAVPVSLAYATADGSAHAGQDYEATSG